MSSERVPHAAAAAESFRTSPSGEGGSILVRSQPAGTARLGNFHRGSRFAESSRDATRPPGVGKLGSSPLSSLNTRNTQVAQNSHPSRTDSIMSPSPPGSHQARSPAAWLAGLPFKLSARTWVPSPRTPSDGVPAHADDIKHTSDIALPPTGPPRAPAAAHHDKNLGDSDNVLEQVLGFDWFETPWYGVQCVPS